VRVVLEKDGYKFPTRPDQQGILPPK